MTLNWAVTGADTLSIAPTPGAVTGNSVTVTPNATTTYTLTATNAGGFDTAIGDSDGRRRHAGGDLDFAHVGIGGDRHVRGSSRRP